MAAVKAWELPAAAWARPALAACLQPARAVRRAALALPAATGLQAIAAPRRNRRRHLPPRRAPAPAAQAPAEQLEPAAQPERVEAAEAERAAAPEAAAAAAAARAVRAAARDPEVKTPPLRGAHCVAQRSLLGRSLCRGAWLSPNGVQHQRNFAHNKTPRLHSGEAFLLTHLVRRSLIGQRCLIEHDSRACKQRQRSRRLTRNVSRHPNGTVQIIFGQISDER